MDRHSHLYLSIIWETRGIGTPTCIGVLSGEKYMLSLLFGGKEECRDPHFHLEGRMNVGTLSSSTTPRIITCKYSMTTPNATNSCTPDQLVKYNKCSYSDPQLLKFTICTLTLNCFFFMVSIYDFLFIFSCKFSLFTA